MLPAIPISHDPGPAMNDVVLVDDHILLSLLLGDEPRELRPRGGIIATTGLWYHRLCPAPAVKAVVESMSRQLGNVVPDIATEVIAAVMELPETFELVSLRSLGWPMGKLVRDGARLNLLALEALAAALSTQAYSARKPMPMNLSNRRLLHREYLFSAFQRITYRSS